MKRIEFLITIIVVTQAWAFSVSAQVPSFESRETTLAKAERFQVIPVGTNTARFAQALDPFYALEAKEDARTLATAQTSGEPVAQSHATASDRVILRQLAERIRPTGAMQFGDSSVLIFGERRVRVGDFLSVPHNGTQYQVEVVKVDARTFTLRLNNELISKRIQ